MIMKNISSLIIISLFPYLTFAADKKVEVVDKIVAIVNSESILQSDLNSFSSRLKKEGSLDESLLLELKAADLKSNRSEQLQFIIREKLVESEVKKQNLEITEDAVNLEVDKLAKKNGLSKSQLEASLKKQGYTLPEYRKTLKSRMERQSFFESEIISKLRITDEDAYNEYKNKVPNYRPNVNEYKIAQIFFDPRKGSAQQALKRATDVYSKMTSGELFESLANKFNEEKSANPDGLLGQFKSGEFNSDLERAVENLDKGQTTAIVKSKLGYHIVKVLDKKVSYDPQFLKYKEQIKSTLIEKNFKRQLKNWFESKKQSSYIKIYE